MADQFCHYFLKLIVNKTDTQLQFTQNKFETNNDKQSKRSASRVNGSSKVKVCGFVGLLKLTCWVMVFFAHLDQ